MNYSEAKEYCNNHYAQLVEFENEEQMNFVKNAVQADGFWWCGFGKFLENQWKNGRGGLLENLILISIKTTLYCLKTAHL